MNLVDNGQMEGHDLADDDVLPIPGSSSLPLLAHISLFSGPTRPTTRVFCPNCTNQTTANGQHLHRVQYLQCRFVDEVPADTTSRLIAITFDGIGCLVMMWAGGKQQVVSRAEAEKGK